MFFVWTSLELAELVFNVAKPTYIYLISVLLSYIGGY